MTFLSFLYFSFGFYIFFTRGTFLCFCLFCFVLFFFGFLLLFCFVVFKKCEGVVFLKSKTRYMYYCYHWGLVHRAINRQQIDKDVQSEHNSRPKNVLPSYICIMTRYYKTFISSWKVKLQSNIFTMVNFYAYI